MISIRSAFSMLSATRGGGARMAASHPPRPTLTLASMSGHRGAIIVEDSNPTTRTARRHRSSPAYRRYLKNQHLHHSSVAPSGWARSSPSTPGEGGGHRQRLREVPSLLISRAMPVGFSEMDNGPLLTIAEMGNHGARVEVLKRHIMAVDGVDYLQAGETFDRIAAKNREGKPAAVLPYHIGIATALICGVGVIPMVFDVSTAQWFNHHFVTTDLPEPHDLETYLEVGSWTWSWMEPPLGTASFILLCLQFSREQMKNLGIKPYTKKIKEIHARNLAKSFPKYDEGIIQEFVETDPMMKW